MAKQTQKPSIYQEAVYDFLVEGSGNAVVLASAGSGKTTTIVNGLKLLPKKNNSIFIAFNGATVKELAKRIPTATRTSTIHGLGWQSMLKHYRKAEFKMNKITDLCYKLFSKNTKFFYIMTVSKVVDLMRLNMAFDPIDLLLLMEKHNIAIPTERNFIEDCIAVLYASIDSRREFDFTDMVFIPALNDDLKLPQYDYVFIDECQDLNAAQQMIFKRLLKKDSRFVAVGDQNQAIYGFAGSDTESFQNLTDEPNTILLPLSICYRCSRAIVEKAKLVVPSIEVYENAEDGFYGSGSWTDIDDGDWVVCRNVRPLVILCMKLIVDGKKATIRGNDIAKSIINTLKKTNQNNKKMCYYILERGIEKQQDILSEFGVENTDTAPSVVEMKEMLALIKYIGNTCRDVDEIIRTLTSIFTDESREGIQMMTIHKSKGLETGRVYFLCPELIPSRYAIQEWQKIQENNLFYVGITRAKTELILVNDFKLESIIKDE